MLYIKSLEYLRVIKSIILFIFFFHFLGKSVKATFPTDTPLGIPEDMNSVSDELLLSAANAIDSSPVVPKTAPKPQTEEKQVGASKGKYSKTAVFERVISNIFLKFVPLFLPNNLY